MFVAPWELRLDAVRVYYAVDEQAKKVIVLAVGAERLAWTPQQRLDADAAFLRFYLALRPEGPLLRD
jgi:hypothetical protein